jgi:hypothetical protein
MTIFNPDFWFFVWGTLWPALIAWPVICFGVWWLFKEITKGDD